MYIVVHAVGSIREVRGFPDSSLLSDLLPVPENSVYHPLPNHYYSNVLHLSAARLPEMNADLSDG